MVRSVRTRTATSLLSCLTLAAVAAGGSACSSSSQNSTDAALDTNATDTGSQPDTSTDAARDATARDAGTDTGTDAARDASVDTDLPRDVPPAMDAPIDVTDAAAPLDASPDDTGPDVPDAGALCSAAQIVPGTPTPIDLFIMLDQSGSMDDTIATGGTKWNAITSAIQTFVQQSGLDNVSVGIQYFGLSNSPNCAPCSNDSQCASGDFCFQGSCFNCQLAGDSCNAADYAVPDVEISQLPGVAPSIVNSINAHSPNSSTPTGPALQGAIDHAKSWASAHPGHVVAAVLATDGEPSECSPADTASIAAIAAAGYHGTPQVRTFALGVFTAADTPSGPDLMNAIATAGGTGQAFNISTSQNVQAEFLMALNQAAYGTCQYALPVPEAGTVNPTQVNVQVSTGDGGTVTIPKVAGEANCPASGDGWYYDNESSPQKILLCSATCNALVAQGGVPSVGVVLDCPTVTSTP